MHQVLVLCVAVVVSAISPPDERTMKLDWEKFKKTYNRTYHTKAEELSRYQIFRERSMMIAKHNQRYSEGQVSYLLGINHFSDRTQQEIHKMTGCALQGLPVHNHSTYEPPAFAQIPEAVDWRQKGAVTPVKNQKMCLSCWAFSTTGAVEGSHFLKTGKLVSLSEQNLVDCVYGPNHMCKGGSALTAMEYIRKNGGIDTEDSYPYKGVEGACHFTKQHVGATVRKVIRVRPGSEADLKIAVATMGPVSVAIDSSPADFKSYKAGVYDNPLCKKKPLDHAVLIVGYGKTNGKKYWIVKNSWSNQWGMKGYALMARGKNQCGIANEGYIPLA